MNKKIYIMLFLAMGLSTIAFCQTTTTLPPVDVKAINAEHDRMNDLIIKSDKVVLPDSTISILKNFAKQKGYRETAVLKSGTILKTLYNKDISKADKLFACKIISRMCESEYTTIPLSLVMNLTNQITKTN
jgi:hypothetical protein